MRSKKPWMIRMSTSSFACLLLSLLIAAVVLALPRRAPSRASGLFFDPHADIRAIYATDRLVAFCKSHDLGSIATNSELADRLEQAGLRRSWYGVASIDRAHDGNFVPSAGYFRPGEAPGEFPTVMLHLAALAGAVPRAQFVRFDDLEIVIVPEPVMSEEPLNALEDLIEVSRPYEGAEDF